ncbi:MAG TPA: sigma-70 family RNA polymerase sigma factor [Planctomycetota bacterium]|nr:sigma-70 family RNA polymerase sigma factor [Planctomycetota bacterium]
MPGRDLVPLSSTEYGRQLELLAGPAAGFALSILRNHTDAQDAVQQAALQGLQRLTQYDPARPFQGWWFAVLRNCCIDLLRARRPHSGLDPDQLARPEPPGDWLELTELLELLPTEQAEILRLRYFGDLSYEDLSEALGIPKGTVMSRLHYARKTLASRMSEEQNP